MLNLFRKYIRKRAIYFVSLCSPVEYAAAGGPDPGPLREVYPQPQSVVRPPLQSPGYVEVSSSMQFPMHKAFFIFIFYRCKINFYTFFFFI